MQHPDVRRRDPVLKQWSRSNRPVSPHPPTTTLCSYEAVSGGTIIKRYAAVLATLLLSSCALVHAQAPAGSTGQCKDGTYTSAASKRGACGGHKGVQAWYAASAATPAAAPNAPSARASKAASSSTAMTSATPAPATAASAPVAAAKPAPLPNSRPTPAPAPTRAAAPSQPAQGGGNGQVWVNTSTKVYHCSGDRYYGKTKEGVYMSEADAKAKGMRADANKPCSAK